MLSDLGIAAVVYVLYRAGLTLGWAWLVKSYVVPYLIVNFWLVTITFLQHTHPNLPHYEDEEWDWLRGALATVDHRWGFLLAWAPLNTRLYDCISFFGWSSYCGRTRDHMLRVGADHMHLSAVAGGPSSMAWVPSKEYLWL